MIQLYGISNDSLDLIPSRRLPKEDDLQRWIAKDATIIGLEMLVLGREVYTDFGGRIDILGLDGEGNLVIVECKRERTPREVIAQLLDYGSWVANLSTRQIHDLALSRLGMPLGKAFNERFQRSLPEKLNTSHSLIVVATEFDASSRRIVEYLARVHQVSINAIFFSCFDHQGENLLAIEWLLDQDEVVQRAENKTSAPWTGLSYVNCGQGTHRDWEDMRTYGFVSAGGKRMFRDALVRLAEGDKLLVYQKGFGYVGMGIVLAAALPADRFQIDGKSILELPLRAADFSHHTGDPELSEYVVRVAWQQTYSLGEAKTFPGISANQNIVCKLRATATIKFLEQYFPISKDVANGTEA